MSDCGPLIAAIETSLPSVSLGPEPLSRISVVALADPSPAVLSVQTPEPSVCTSQDPEAPVSLALVSQGPRGPQGDPGPEGGNAVQRLAGETLSALRIVFELDGEVFYLDRADAAHVDLLLGVTTSSAAVGEAINVRTSGSIDEPAWTFTPGPVWLGDDGALTQTPPADGFDVLIGAAVSATRINLNIQEPIDLSE